MENERYAMQGRFVCHPGKVDELAAILVAAGQALEADASCLLYAVFRAPEEPDSVYVTEAWVDEAAHRASLEAPETRAAIALAMPLIASVEGKDLRPLGGKGL
jgi:quinol monooxygenase YgiN